jgi:hypothetical protein
MQRLEKIESILLTMQTASHRQHNQLISILLEKEATADDMLHPPANSIEELESMLQHKSLVSIVVFH